VLHHFLVLFLQAHVNNREVEAATQQITIADEETPTQPAVEEVHTDHVIEGMMPHNNTHADQRQVMELNAGTSVVRSTDDVGEECGEQMEAQEGSSTGAQEGSSDNLVIENCGAVHSPKRAG